MGVRSRSKFKLKEDRFVTGICKGYRPEARGYVIYSPRALPEGAARG